MAVIGKVSSGKKKKDSRVPIQTGWLIKKLTKENAGKVTEQNEIDKKAQMALVKYNFPKDVEAAVAKDKAEGKTGIGEALESVLNEKWEKCYKLPCKILSVYDYSSGHMCWPKKKSNQSFCISTTIMNEKSNHVASRFIEETGEREDVACNPRTCPYALEETENTQKCKSLTRLNIVLDLPNIPASYGTYWTYKSSGYNAKKALYESLQRVRMACGDSLFGIKFELVLEPITMSVQDIGEKIHYVPKINFRDETDESLLEKSLKNSQRIIQWTQASKAMAEMTDALARFKEQATEDLSEVIEEQDHEIDEDLLTMENEDQNESDY